MLAISEAGSMHGVIHACLAAEAQLPGKALRLHWCSGSSITKSVRLSQVDSPVAPFLHFLNTLGESSKNDTCIQVSMVFQLWFSLLP